MTTARTRSLAIGLLASGWILTATPLVAAEEHRGEDRRPPEAERAERRNEAARTTTTTATPRQARTGGGTTSDADRARAANRESVAPNGANGTIHTTVTGCDLTVRFYGFDTGSNSVVVTITDIDTRAVLERDVFTATFPTRTSGNTFDTARTYTIPGIHHVKVVAEVTSAKGTATKQKVEWIRCASATAASTGSARASGAVMGATAERDTARETEAAAQGRRAAGRAASGEDDTRVLGTGFERDDPPAFAFTGMGLVRLLVLAGALVLAGWTALHFTRRRDVGV